MTNFFVFTEFPDLSFFNSESPAPEISELEYPFTFSELIFIISSQKLRLDENLEIEFTESQLTTFLQEIRKICKIIDSTPSITQRVISKLYQVKLDFVISLLFRIPDKAFQFNARSEMIHILNHLSYCETHYHSRLVKLGTVEFTFDVFHDLGNNFKNDDMENLIMFFSNTIQDSPMILSDYFEYELFEFLKIKLDLLVEDKFIKKKIFLFVFNSSMILYSFVKLILVYINVLFLY